MIDNSRYFIKSLETQVQSLYEDFDDFSPETKAFLSLLNDLDTKTHTLAFNPDGSFIAVKITNGQKSLPEMSVTIDTDEVQESVKDLDNKSCRSSKIMTAAKVAILIGSGIALTYIYQHSEELLGLSKENLMNHLKNIKTISFKKPLEQTSEYIRDKLLGNKEVLMCNFSTEGSGTSQCHYEDMPITWKEGFKDLKDNLLNAKLVKGILKQLMSGLNIFVKIPETTNSNPSQNFEISLVKPQTQTALAVVNTQRGLTAPSQITHALSVASSKGSEIASNYLISDESALVRI